ncbi:hypothetical protein [Lacticaseibacillus rhamnosus]|uniref:hypothetical protein n=1 Tax=Lacticaseibacillus rhamnosus TaxID=47715 RepID=UPI00321A4328
MARTKAEIKAWEHEMAQRATEQLSALADTQKFKQYLRQNAAFQKLFEVFERRLNFR